MTPETLAGLVVLGDLNTAPTNVCGAWMESAERRCGRPAADPWLCTRHLKVAQQRAIKHAAKDRADHEKAQAREAAAAPKLRAELARINARLARLDPPRTGPLDHGVLNTPIRTRMYSDSRITELAWLHERRKQLMQRVGEETA